ncbi:cysteine desulfurase family protein [Aquimarina algiphila]|uniref:cysteine desulfurase n=1 Tax=Aquimarina algiphila TaxID=2047982 RepID=A0A554VBR5_9FLAO|nr:cysteine desulfurase family protein [Aquimarina algiphila]TSE04050.1 cysteine desulfurase [Aquimarina algiphila]
MTDLPLYLDYASTTPINKKVLDEMLPYFEDIYGNAASMTHKYGDLAKKAVLKAQSRIANLIVAEAEEIYFTSGATESINLALKGIYQANKKNGNHIITVKTEHKAVLDTCSYLEDVGADITYLDVSKDGLVDLNELKSNIKKTTVLVCIMYVNNETGVIQDVNSIGRICKESNILFFSDATQAFGKLPINVNDQNIDLLCFSGHKIYAPKGVAGLYIKRGIELQMQIHGGGHQNRMRSGSLNVSGIVGLGKASEIAKENMKEEYERIKELRDKLENTLLKQNKICINGSGDKRSPYISNIQLIDQEADDFIMRNRNKIALATGSACNSEIIESSHVLKAMGLNENECNETIRISYGIFSDLSDIQFLLNQV